MKKTKKKSPAHPGRDEIMAAVRLGNVPFSSHLEECRMCRTIFKFLKMSLGGRSGSPPKPPTDLLAKHATLPFLIGNWEPGQVRTARVTHDSWNGLPALALRDASMGMERRLSFSAGALVLELVASRRLSGWRFAARVYDGGKPSRKNVLKIGRVRRQPGYQDCYYWNSSQPPRTLQLLSPDLQINIGDIEW
jgi:hypothetical protein